MRKTGRILLLFLISLMLTGCGIFPEPYEKNSGSSFHSSMQETVEEEFPKVTVPKLELPVFTVPETTEAAPWVPETTAAETAAPETLAAETTEPVKAPAETYRPAYLQGSCREFSGKVYTLSFYLDDSESSWDPAAVDGYSRIVADGYAYLEQQAAQWGVDLDIESYQFSTDEDYTIRYPGTFGSLEQARENYDVLPEIAQCLGFQNKEAMDQYFLDYFDTDQVAYNVILNKPGRSYTMPDREDDGFEVLEYSVFYKDFENGVAVNSFTVAHETMHLFGAEDYYDPMGDRPNRYALAQRLYPDDLMLRWDDNVYSLSVSDVTAYSVGWTHPLPAVVLDPDWWS